MTATASSLSKTDFSGSPLGCEQCCFQKPNTACISAPSSLGFCSSCGKPRNMTATAAAFIMKKLLPHVRTELHALIEKDYPGTFCLGQGMCSGTRPDQNGFCISGSNCGNSGKKLPRIGERAAIDRLVEEHKQLQQRIREQQKPATNNNNQQQQQRAAFQQCNNTKSSCKALMGRGASLSSGNSASIWKSEAGGACSFRR